MKKQINVPSIIFSRFNEDSSWKSKKFKELLDPTEGIRRGPFGSALKKEFFVQNSEYVVYEQQNAIYDHFNTRYRISEEKYHELKKIILLPGDFIMSGAGTIGKISLVPEGIEKGVFNQALIRLRVNKNTDKEFFLQWMRSPEMQNKLTKANPASAMVNLVPMSEVKEWDVIVPSLDEQFAIGSLFRTLDDLLASYKDNLANYQSLKATMLSKMFPKAGQSVPEIRLDGFEGEWEEKEFSKLVKRVTQSSDSDSLPKVEFEDIISGQGRLNKDISNKFDNRKGIHFKPGYTLYGKLRPYLNNWLLPKFEGVALGDFWVFDPNGNDSNFIYYLVQSNRYQKVANDTSGTKMPRSDWKSVSSTIFAIPQKVAEQQDIGAYFSNLDNLIAAHQEKISQLETLKKKLLQDMFI